MNNGNVTSLFVKSNFENSDASLKKYFLVSLVIINDVNLQ